MKHNNSDLRAENSNLNKENEQLKDKVGRMKKKKILESTKISKTNLDNEELTKVTYEELEEVNMFILFLKNLEIIVKIKIFVQMN